MNEGKVKQVIGPTVDVEFTQETLPQILNEIRIEDNINNATVVAEVAQHTGNNTVRCVAMSSTDGLVRGMKAVDTGQPITVPELLDLRGVRSASVVRTLLEKKLVRIVGRKPVVGRPLMYGTTKEFLLRFGLKDLRDLPQLKDMSEVFGDEVAQQLEGTEVPEAPEAP